LSPRPPGGRPADGEGQQRLGQRHAQVAVDVALGDEPAPDALGHHRRLAEEEGRLPVVVEHEVRQQARRRHHLPKGQQRQQQRHLPDTQVAGLRFQRVPHADLSSPFAARIVADAAAYDRRMAPGCANEPW
jgi:hypothetical protein